MKVVITEHSHPDLTIESEIFHKIGAHVICPMSSDEEALIEICKDADAIINEFAKISARVINNMNKCKVIGHYGIGLDSIDVNKATENGIMVCNVPDYCIDEVSSHALALIMCLVRKITKGHKLMETGGWGYKSITPIRRISGVQTLGLIGFGKIGRALAQKAQAVGFSVVGFDPFIEPEVFRIYNVTHIRELEQILSMSDIISIHSPLNSQTERMIGINEFRLMKPHAYLINASRGAIVDEEALIKALEKCLISGAGIDAFTIEPPVNSKLLSLDNVILTPHIAYYSEEAVIELRAKIANSVASALSGQIPDNLVNPESLKKAGSTYKL